MGWLRIQNDNRLEKKYEAKCRRTPTTFQGIEDFKLTQNISLDIEVPDFWQY
jgi:hypothetical protein